LAVAPDTLKLIPGFALAIGIGWRRAVRRCSCSKTGAAMLALCLPIGIGEALIAQGLAAFARPVLEAHGRSAAGCARISHGLGRIAELGTAGGTAHYLEPIRPAGRASPHG
jgi:hypothetical protein